VVACTFYLSISTLVYEGISRMWIFGDQLFTISRLNYLCGRANYYPWRANYYPWQADSA